MQPLLNWREYFEGEELDKAYQIVEVEQRDETDKEVESMGSDSNPSEDNYEAEELYKGLFRLENAEMRMEQRLKKETEFARQVAEDR